MLDSNRWKYGRFIIDQTKLSEYVDDASEFDSSGSDYDSSDSDYYYYDDDPARGLTGEAGVRMALFGTRMSGFKTWS